MAKNPSVPEVQGLVGWLMAVLSGWRGRQGTQEKQMQLVETLALGGKRQLMLVSCGAERFLVGAGAESVETIVRITAGGAMGIVGKSLDGVCQ